MGSRHRIVISFMGVDGSGKTTLSLKLHNKLKEIGVVSTYCHTSLPLTNLIPKSIRTSLWEKLFRRSGDFKKKDYKITSIKKTHKQGVLFHSYLFFVLLNNILSYLLSIKFRRGVILYDRYLYDYIVDFVDCIPNWLIRIYVEIIPQPDAIFFLKVAPETAYMRDREHELYYYNDLQRKIILFLKTVKCKVFTIDTTSLSIEEMCNIAFRYLHVLLGDINV